MLRAGSGTTGRRNAHYRAIMGAGSPPPPPIVCAYPLNATLAQMQSLGFNALIPVSNHQQTATYTVLGGQSNTYTAAAFTNLGAPQTLDFVTKPAAIEFAFTTPASLVTNDAVISISGEMITLDFAHSVLVTVGNRAVGGVNTFILRIAVNGTTRYSDLARVTPATLVAIRIDPATSKFQAYVNNDVTPLPILLDSVNPGHYAVGVQTSESTNVDMGDAGKQYVCDVRTGAPYFQTTVLPGGTSDGCGNLIENYALKWDGAQHVNGGSIVTSNGGRTLAIHSSGPSQFTAVKSAAFPVSGLWKYVVRVSYTVLPDVLYLGMGTAALDVDTFANQVNNVESVYTSGNTSIHAFCNGDSAVGTSVTSGVFDMSFYDDTGTGNWSYKDSLGNTAVNIGATVGSAVPPLGLFCYFQGLTGATLTILQTDGTVPGLPSNCSNVGK